MSRSLLLFPVLFVLLISCNGLPGEVEDAVPPAPEVSLSDDELVELGYAIQHEFNEGSGKRFDASFDVEQFFLRMVWPHSPNDKEIEEFVKGYTDKAQMDGAGFGERLAKQFQAGGTVHFMRVDRGEEGVRLLLRFVGADRALNYLEFLVADGKDGRPVLVDMYSAMSGENLSRTLRRLYLGSNNVVARLLGEKGEIAKQAVEGVEKMNRLIAEGKNTEALRYFNSLPKKVQEQKALQLARVRAAVDAGDNEQYAAYIKELREQYPNDVGMDLLQVDYFFIRKEYDSVLAAYDRLDKRVRDPYLDHQRAYVYLVKGDLERAAQSANAVVRWDSTLVEPYYILVAVANKKKDYTAVAQALERMQQTNGGTVEIDFEVIESNAEYADFVASKEYAALKRKYQ